MTIHNYKYNKKSKPYGYRTSYGYKGAVPVISKLEYTDEQKKKLYSLKLSPLNNMVVGWEWREFCSQDEYEKEFDEIVNEFFDDISKNKTYVRSKNG